MACLAPQTTNTGSVSPTTPGRRHTYKVNIAKGVTTPREEEDVGKSSQLRASKLEAVVALEAEVGGLHHVGNTSPAEDGAKGLEHKAMAKLETTRTRVTATKWRMIPIRVH